MYFLLILLVLICYFSVFVEPYFLLVCLHNDSCVNKQRSRDLSQPIKLQHFKKGNFPSSTHLSKTYLHLMVSLISKITTLNLNVLFSLITYRSIVHCTRNFSFRCFLFFFLFLLFRHWQLHFEPFVVLFVS